jgi:nucleoside-diphosphate-sugar epimerase
MHVFVAGGSGVLGRAVVAQLVDRGHRVTATTTSADKLDRISDLKVSSVLMNGLDSQSVATAVATAKPDVIVHQMTAINPAHAGKADLKRIDKWMSITNGLRTKGTDHLLDAAEANGVEHIVAHSYASWNGMRSGSWIKSEQEPLDPYIGTAAESQMSAIHHLETRVREAGGTVLRLGSLYGPGATDEQVELLRRRQFPLVGTGAGHWSWIHVEDAAAATVLGVEQRPEGTFNIVDDEPARVSEWLPHLAKCAGAKAPMRIPLWLAKLFAGEVVVQMMTEGRAFSNAKAKAELDFRLRFSSWRQGFRDGLV